MSTEIVMPKLGESLVEGKVGRWLKREGDPIELNEPILEIETDKVTTEIPSSDKGLLIKIIVEEGDTVSVGTVLGYIGVVDEVVPLSTTMTAKAVPTATAAVIFPVAPRIDAEHDITPLQIKGSGPNEKTVQEDVITHLERSSAVSKARVPSTLPYFAHPPEDVYSEPSADLVGGLISPLVSQLAAHYNIDVRSIIGSGKGGRVRKDDILAYLTAHGITHSDDSQLAADQMIAAVEKPLPSEDNFIPHNAMRRAIAEHMVRSVRTSPHVTTVMEVDLSAVIAHRGANKDAFAQQGVKLTFMPYFVLAAALALRQHPLVNSSWQENGVQLYNHIDIGMATALENNGLIVPVIRRVDEKLLLGVTRSVNDLAIRARANQLRPDEIAGATFTVTNHGASGSLMATPIISQPQSAILGIGAIEDRVKVIQTAIAIRSMVYLSLSFDHRVLDGTSADHFLATVKQTLEQWNHVGL